MARIASCQNNSECRYSKVLARLDRRIVGAVKVVALGTIFQYMAVWAIVGIMNANIYDALIGLSPGKSVSIPVTLNGEDANFVGRQTRRWWLHGVIAFLDSDQEFPELGDLAGCDLSWEVKRFQRQVATTGNLGGIFSIGFPFRGLYYNWGTRHWGRRNVFLRRNARSMLPRLRVDKERRVF